MIAFICNVHSSQSYKARQGISGCLELGEGRNGERLLWGDENILHEIVVMVAQHAGRSKYH